jgi:spore germination cell wall hydrolase CwlJ-like protein
MKPLNNLQCILLIASFSIFTLFSTINSVKASTSDSISKILDPAYNTEVRTVRPYNESEVECLAINIYHEARGSSFADRVAVTDVVLNRVRDRRYPNTICEVVMQGEHSEWHMTQLNKKVPLRNRCHFSWYCDGKSDKPNDENAWQDALHLAGLMYYYNEYVGITEGATHYHASHVDPYWAPTLQKVGIIGGHVFYRWVK